ncbi:hypothetical protein K227x_61890 [Rubripirellula lacrimiformis]|uniref:Uncharacterized protein n=1 Tax=Rubripirellula lacrimiformis TaxID=1930273 RepID=A0A517NKV6_9BACT|nr:hypothetical protein K227x_61890 [Rubripirellula lacrimiformis]
MAIGQGRFRSQYRLQAASSFQQPRRGESIMPVASGHRILHSPMIFWAGPPEGGPAQKIQIVSVIANRSKNASKKHCCSGRNIALQKQNRQSGSNRNHRVDRRQYAAAHCNAIGSVTNSGGKLRRHDQRNRKRLTTSVNSTRGLVCIGWFAMLAGSDGRAVAANLIQHFRDLVVVLTMSRNDET